MFSFPDEWIPVRYETCAAYKNKMLPLQNTCAIDFLFYHKDHLVFFEVMRYRKADRIDPGFISDKVTAQLRDTVCGLAVCQMLKDPEMAMHAQALFSHRETRRSHKLILFLEIENASPKLSPEEIKADILQALKNRFVRWGFAVRIHDTRNMADAPWQATVV